MTDIASFEERALKAEKELEELKKKVAHLEQLVARKATSGGSVSFSSSSSSSSSVGDFFAPRNRLPPGHTAYTWGNSGEAQVATTTTTSSQASSQASEEQAIKFYNSVISSYPSTHDFANRWDIKKIVARGDKGLGLVGKEVIVAGWAKTVREQGGGRFAFLELNDGSTFLNLQIIVDKEVEGFAEIISGSSNTGASYLAVGTIVEPAVKSKNIIELKATRVHLLGPAEAATYPLPKKPHTVEYLRTVSHLRVRTNLIGAVARIRNACAFATHKFFQENGFYYVHTPILTSSDCEGAGETFHVTTLFGQEGSQFLEAKKVPDFKHDFFGKKAYLTVSGQLNVETYACGLSKVYTFGPTFRAEHSFTARHLAEFWMIEPEIAFADLNDDMNYSEAYLKYLVQYVLDNCAEDLEFFNEHIEKGLLDRLKNVLETPFVRITYTEGIDLLLKSNKEFKVKPEWGMDMGTEHERYLAEEVFKKPTIVRNYPKGIKAFYMRVNEDQKTVAAMDILVPKVGEIIGGSQREERFDVLTKRIEEMGLQPEAYSWYLDLRKYGTVMHSGFGLGFERLIMFVTGIENIRDVIPFPRWPGHIEF